MRNSPQRNRTAFTLIELVVACFVFGTGVLALTSTSVAVARLTGDAARAGAAAERGHARMEAMRAGACVARAGTMTAGGIIEWWGAALASEGQLLTDSVQYPDGARHNLRTESLSSAAWCP